MEENNVKLLTFLEVKNIYRQEKGKLGPVPQIHVLPFAVNMTLNLSIRSWIEPRKCGRVVKALWGDLAAGREKEGERATMSRNIWISASKNVDANCWLVEMTLVMTSLPLTRFFLMLVFIRARFRFALIGGNLTAQSTRSHRGLGIPETWLQALFPFPAPPPEHPGKLARRLSCKRVGLVIWRSLSSPALKTHWICQYYPVPGSEIVGSVNINWKRSNTKIKRDESPFIPPPSSFLRLRAHVFVCLSLTSSLLPESLEQANII